MATGSVEPRRRQNGSVGYRARWDNGIVDGKRDQGSKTFDRKREADAYLREVMGRKANPSRVPLGEYVDTWLQGRLDRGEIKAITYVRHQTALRGRFSSLMTIPLEDLTRRQVEACVHTARAEGLATVAAALVPLSGALNNAVRLSELRENPARGISPGKIARYQPPVWAGAQMGAFLTANKDDPGWGVVWLVLARTLLRLGEVMALRWSDVDLVTGTLSVRRTATIDEEGRLIFGPPKSESGIRVIPLGPALVSALRGHRARQNERRLRLGRRQGAQCAAEVLLSEDGVLADRGEPVGGGERVRENGSAVIKVQNAVQQDMRADELGASVGELPIAHSGGWHDLDLVFDRGDGRHLIETRLRKALDVAIAAAGLPRITPHGFRHSGASFLLNVERVPVKIVSRLLGHAAVQITLDIYTHPDADTSRAAIERLEDMGS